MYGILTLLLALTLGSEVQNIGKNEPPGCDVNSGEEEHSLPLIGIYFIF